MTDARHAGLRLHGYPVSNYFNIVRAALLEKRVEFDVVPTRAAQDADFLTRNPMGKIPLLETPHGWLAETVAMLEYLEDTVPAPALYPVEAYRRAQARQIINVVQMYVEAQSRPLYVGVFFGQANDERTVAATRVMLDRATQALRRLLRPEPYFFGASPGHADLFAFYCLDIADRVTRAVYDRSLWQEIGTLGEWTRLMAQRESTQRIFADFYPAFVDYLAARGASYDCRLDLAVPLPPALVMSGHATR